MDATAAPALQDADADAVPAPPKVSAPRAGVSFHDVLSALNPLQYLPVVGTIYRAVTGDVIPESLRLLGSFAASGLMGGPIGMLVNVGSAALQKLADIEPDRIAHSALAAVGLIGPEPAQVAKVWTYAPAEAEGAAEAGDPGLGRRAADAYGRAQMLAAG